jgi:hypothetical protein
LSGAAKRSCRCGGQRFVSALLARGFAFLLAWSAWAAAAAAAPSDVSVPVRFAAGAAAAEITGGIARGEVACFTVAARKGQHMRVSQPGREDSNIVIQIYAPRWLVARSPNGIRVRGLALPGAAEGQDAKTWSGTLPTSGNYLLVLGTTWGGGEYRLRVEID